MSIQRIIDGAETIEIKRQKLTGQSISRSGIIKTSTVASHQPWLLTVSFPDGLRFSENRDLVEELDRIDRSTESTIDIGNTNPGLNYITSYQGEFSQSQLNAITVDTASASNITLNVSAVSGSISTDIVFEPGDYVQIDSGYRYPYTVTQRVLRGVGNTITVPINRPFITQTGFSVGGQGILVGPSVTWRVICLTRPSWRIIPRDILGFSGEFELIEVIEESS